MIASKRRGVFVRLGAALAAAASLWMVGMSAALADGGGQPDPYAIPAPWEYFPNNPGEMVHHNDFPRHDINGDGIPDLIVTAPSFSEAHPQHGRVTVISGWDSGPRYLFDAAGPEPNDLFGYSLCVSEGFFDAGRPAIVIGAPGSTVAGMSRAGRVYVYGGPTHALQFIIQGVESDSGFGLSVADIGDINGDGRSDIAIGAPGDTTGVRGKVYIFFGMTLDAAGPLSLISAEDADLVLTSPEEHDWFGFSIAGGVDLTGDDVPDVAVGAPLFPHNGLERAGAAYVYSGATGQVHSSILGASAKAQVGFSLVTTPPQTDEDESYLFVGAPGEFLAGVAPALTPGRVGVFSSGEFLQAGARPFDHATRLLSPTEPTGTMYGVRLQRAYAAPGSLATAVLVGYGMLLPAPQQVIDHYSLSPSITWYVSAAMTARYEAPYAARTRGYLTVNGDLFDMTHPYTGPTEPPATLSSLTMKHHGDATGDFKVDTEDLYAIMTKWGATGDDAGDADIDGDGVVTIDDLTIALTNLGMTLIDAIRRDCDGGLLFDEMIHETPCDCVRDIGTTGPADIIIDPEELDEPPCPGNNGGGNGGGGGGGGGGNPGQDCGQIPIEEPSDCDAFADCIADNRHGPRIQDLQNQIDNIDTQLQQLRDDRTTLQNQISAAAQVRNSSVQAAKQQIRNSGQSALENKDSDNATALKSMAVDGAAIGLALGALATDFSFHSFTIGAIGGLAGIGTWAHTTLPGIVYDKKLIRESMQDSFDAIDAAANGDPSAGRPVHPFGVRVSVSAWSVLVQNGLTMAGLTQQLAALQQQISQLHAQQRSLRTALINEQIRRTETRDAARECCLDSLEGFDCELIPSQ